ncbi:hypothetical protein ACWEIJ_17165 [Lentzea sp. NPDC004789]
MSGFESGFGVDPVAPRVGRVLLKSARSSIVASTKLAYRVTVDPAKWVGWKSSAAVLAVLATFITVDRLRLGQREHHPVRQASTRVSHTHRLRNSTCLGSGSVAMSTVHLIANRSGGARPA